MTPLSQLIQGCHGYMACLPRGQVRVVRHDIPDGADTDAGVAARH
nr:hypothetical protein [Mycobacterium kyorinense]